MHPRMKHVYIGIDVHKSTHTAVIVNCFSEKLGEITFPNKPSEFEKFLCSVETYAKKGVTPVFGLEDTMSSGRELARFLLSKNKTVKQVAASLTYSLRHDQAVVSKNDSYDAYCVAKNLLDKFNTLPDAAPNDIYWTLGMLVNRRASIVKANTALKNQIQDNIRHHYPSYRKLFTVFDSRTALEFWCKYPSPAKLTGVSVKELADFLHEYSSGFFGEEKAVQILDIIASDGYTLTEYQDERDMAITFSVDEVKQNIEKMKRIESTIEKLMDRLDYRLETMIGVDLVTAAGFVAGIGDISRFSSADKLARYCGIAPVEHSSGDKGKNNKCDQGKRKLHQLFRDLAARSINRGRNKDKPVNDIFYEYYQKKLSQGKTKHQALICVMRRLVNIIYGLMKNKTAYVHPQKADRPVA